MKKRIIVGILLVLTLILLAPTISAFNSISKNKTDQLAETNNNYFLKYLKKQTLDEPPSWFTFLHTFIMLSLNIRILLLTSLAVTPSSEYWGAFEIKSYFFAFILFTLIYRFVFWYKLFHNIAERNNWDIYLQNQNIN